MRIDRLDLTAFGPFTGQSLALDGGQYGLHVVYGTNEAGKSSALRALVQFLFGFPHNSSDNFRHANPDLRIGARLSGASNRVLDCIRRKGKSNTLRGSDDATIIEPARLTGLLGGLDESAFSLQFGINCESLKRGGEAIVEGHGDVGTALFAAGSGIVDLRRIQESLADEAEALFLPRGKVQKINKALSELDIAKKRIRDSLLSTSDWQAQDERRRKAEERKRWIDGQFVAKCAERSRLDRIEKALPLMARRGRALAELEGVADAPLLPADFSEQRRLAQAELSKAQAEEIDSAQHLERLQRLIADSNPPQGLLDHRTAIEQLFEDLGAYRKADRDRPLLERQVQSLQEDARSILRDLVHESDLERVESLRLNRVARNKIQTLSQNHKNLESKYASARERAENLQSELTVAESRLAGAGAVQESGVLKQALQRMRQHGDLDQRIAEARGELEKLRQQATIELKRLPLFSGSLDEVERLAVPTLETIDRFDAELSETANELTQLEQRIAEAGQQLGKLDEHLERLRLELEVPTEEDLTVARQKREEGWKFVRQAWLEGQSPTADVDAFVAELAPGDKLVEAFEASIALADNVADRLRREAESVAQNAQLVASRMSLVEHQGKLLGQRGGAQRRLGAVQESWALQWQPLGIIPQSPREMRAWHDRQSLVVTAAAAVRKQEGALKELERLTEECRIELQGALGEHQQPLAHTSSSLLKLVQQGEAVVEAAERKRAERDGLQRELERLGKERTKAQRECDNAHEELKCWHEEWQEVTRPLRLAEGACPADAIQVVEAIDELLHKLKEAEGFQKRIGDIDRDAGLFSKRLQQLQEILPAELAHRPIDRSVADLHDRLANALRIQDRLDDLRGQHDREENRLKGLRLTIRRLHAELEQMCRTALCQTADQLSDAEERSRQRRECEQQVKEAEERISDLSAGAALADFLADAASAPADQLQPNIQRLTEEIERLEHERGEVLQTIGSAKTELQRMDGSERAALAQEEASALAAQIYSDAEHFRRLRLASAVLRAAIERYREKHQGPVMKRASELFERLTLGSYEGLRADDDDAGRMVLMGVRPGSRQTVPVECMSDGARDQLYLAFRLASLHSYLDAQEPIPFIVDDILIQFDDERAAAALEALAELSARTQVIFFTHHEHLVELAARRLPSDVVFTHLLDCRTLPAAPLSVAGMA